MDGSAGPGPDWHFPSGLRMLRGEQWLTWNRDLCAHLERVGLDHVFYPPGARSSADAQAARQRRGKPTFEEVQRTGNIICFGIGTKLRFKLFGPLPRSPNPSQLWDTIREWCDGCSLEDDSDVSRTPSPSEGRLQLVDYQSALRKITSIQLADFTNIDSYCNCFNGLRNKLAGMGCAFTNQDYILLYIQGIQDVTGHCAWIEQALDELAQDPSTTLHRVEFISWALPQKPPPPLAERIKRPQEMDTAYPEATDRPATPPDQKRHEGRAFPLDKPPGAVTDSPDRGRSAVRGHELATPDSRSSRQSSASIDMSMRKRDFRKPGTCNHKNHRPEACFIDHPELHWGARGRPKTRSERFEPAMDRYQASRDRNQPSQDRNQSIGGRMSGTCRHFNHRPEDCYIDHPELRLKGGVYDSYKPHVPAYSEYGGSSRDRRALYDAESHFSRGNAPSRDHSIKREGSRSTHTGKAGYDDERTFTKHPERGRDNGPESSVNHGHGFLGSKVRGSAGPNSGGHTVKTNETRPTNTGFQIKGGAGGATDSAELTRILADETETRLHESPTAIKPDSEFPGPSGVARPMPAETGNVDGTKIIPTGPRGHVATGTTSSVPTGPRNHAASESSNKTPTGPRNQTASGSSNSVPVGPQNRVAGEKAVVAKTANANEMDIDVQTNAPATDGKRITDSARNEPAKPEGKSQYSGEMTARNGNDRRGAVPSGSLMTGDNSIPVGGSKAANTSSKAPPTLQVQKEAARGSLREPAGQPNQASGINSTALADQGPGKKSIRQASECAVDRALDGVLSYLDTMPAGNHVRPSIPSPRAGSGPQPSAGADASGSAPRSAAPASVTRASEVSPPTPRAETSQEAHPPPTKPSGRPIESTQQTAASPASKKRKMSDEVPSDATPQAAAPPAPKKRWGALEMMKAYAPSSRNV